MTMDETPVNSEPTASSLPKIDVFKPKSLCSWTALGMSVFAVVLSGTTIVSYYQLHSQMQRFATFHVTQPVTTKNLQTMQDHIQQLGTMQQQFNTQMAQTQQQLQRLIDTQTAPIQDWDIQTARYYLDLAQISAEWAPNNRTTLHLLQRAQQVLANHTQAGILPIRQAITQDIAAIMQIPAIDTQGVLEKLSSIQQQITQLSAQKPFQHTARTDAPSPSITNWRANWEHSMQQLRGLISIRYQDESVFTPFSPDNMTLLRENIDMNLQQAALGLLEHNQTLYSQAVQAALHNLTFGFNQADPTLQTIRQALQALQTVSVAYPMPKLQPYPQLFAAYSNASTAVSPSSDPQGNS